ncbi:unnamed protein product [Caenorhabditis sp. 36 PRJEB53466]|nr:unnamed protein product [Caenorhabditis sp. 36 PRJEB53466]
MESSPSLTPTKIEKPAENGAQLMADGQKGKLRNLWSRCIVGPSALLGSSIVRSWAQMDFKDRLASVAAKRMNLVAKCMKRFPEVSLNCQISASFSLNSPKTNETTAQDLEKQERCRKIARIEHEIRTLERHLESRNY